MTFEPTQPQDGVDPNMFTLIDPGAIPYPLTDTWSLNYAAETLRTGGENLFGGAEDMHATWGGLQAHYVAPESETLFAAMNPVVTRGEDIQSDLATVAGALEELADAAATARSSLNTLKIEAQSFWNKHHDKKVWWLDKDDETDEWAIQENIRLKDGVNTAWATFNEAENACATRISTLFGGPSYASPDQAGGDDVLVYGLPTDAGEREGPGFDETLMDPANDFTAWLGTEFHPSMASFSNSTDQAAWDNIVVDGLWGSAVGLAGLSGVWHPQGGWQITPGGRWENVKSTVDDGWMDAMTFIGIHDDQGWVAEGAEGTRLDRWTTNIGVSWDQAVEGHTAWSRREEDPEYTGSTSVLNTALMTVGIPLKIGTTVLTLGPGGEAITPSHRDGSYSDGYDQNSAHGGRTPMGPSSPLPRHLEEGTTPIGERFGHDLTLLRESLLDPEQHRDTPAPQPDGLSPTPNRPVAGDGVDQPARTPITPERGDTPHSQNEGSPPHRPHEEADAPRSQERPGSPASTTGSDDGPRRGDSDEPGDGASRDEQERPEPATGGGEGGGNQPPRDRTRTGGDDGDPNDGGNDGGDPRDGGEQSDVREGGGEDGGADGQEREDVGAGHDDEIGQQPYRTPQPGTPEYENRLQELMDDPASGAANTSHKEAAVRREAEVGLAAERHGLIEGPIRRAEMDYSNPKMPKDQGDFFDATGQAWDVKGYRDTFPPTAGPRAGQPFPPGFKAGFNIAKVEKAILKELEDGENVLLDLGGLSDPNNRASIEGLVQNNPQWIGKVLIVDV